MSDKRRASSVLHITPECLERLKKLAAKEHVTMGELVEILLDERERRG
jgi:hypothetical protein